MPLGDSITASSAGQASYRYYLWQLAIGRGYKIDFVGSQHGVSGGAPKFNDFDMDHEGHGGWTTDQILAQVRSWAANTSPDFVLIHLGDNDMAAGQDSPGIVKELGQIIDQTQDRQSQNSSRLGTDHSARVTWPSPAFHIQCATPCTHRSQAPWKFACRTRRPVYRF